MLCRDWRAAVLVFISLFLFAACFLIGKTVRYLLSHNFLEFLVVFSWSTLQTFFCLLN